MRVDRTALVVALLTVGWAVPSAHAVQRTWDGSTDNNWQWPFNWSGNAVPGNADTAVIGGAPNNNVVLNADALQGIDGLTVSGGAILSTNGLRLLVDDAGTAVTTVGPNGTILVPEVAADPGLFGLDTDRLVIQNNATFSNAGRTVVGSTARVDVGGTMASGGEIVLGNNFGIGGTGLNNNGTITASVLGATDLTLMAANTSRLDLDGDLNNGVVRATADGLLGAVAASRLTFRGALTDPFSGLMEIARRDTIAFDEDWELDGRLVFRGGNGADAARLEDAEGNAATLRALPGATIEVLQGTAVIRSPIEVEGATFRPAGNTTVSFVKTSSFVGGADLDLTAGNITLDIQGQVFVTQPIIDLDGSGVGGSHTLDIGMGPSSSSLLSLFSDLTDAFDGTINFGDDATVSFRGDAVISPAATLNFGGANAALNIGGQTTINAPLDMIQLADDTIDVFRSDAVLTIAGPITGGGVYRGDIKNSGTLNLNRNTFAGGWAQRGRLRLEKIGDADPVINGVKIVVGVGFDGGELSGDGVVHNDVENVASGRIAPGTRTTAGRLTFTGTLDLMSGVTDLEVGGPTPGTEHDQLLGGTLNIDGGEELQLGLIGGYLPALYTEHVLADFALLTGVFGVGGAAVIPATGTGLAVTYDYATGRVLMQRAILGDANLNGQVEQGDLDAVLQNWGDTTGVSWATGDLNGNGTVEQGDLDFVLQNWGDTSVPDSGGFDAARLPEPGFTGLALVGALVARRPRWRRPPRFRV